MGKLFPLIADEALQTEDPSYYPECQVCGICGVSVYRCQGFQICDDGTIDRTLDVYAACERCLKGGRIAHLDEYRTDPLIERYAQDPASEKAVLRTTPRVPLQIQGDDWPICCGKLSEFVGSPNSVEELVAAQEKGQFWDLGIETTGYIAKDQGPPESLREVSFFKCRTCGKLYWVFQPT